MYQTVGLIITLILGMFILIGCIISFVSDRKEKYVDFSIALAFGVMITLLFLDLLPEAALSLGIKSIHWFVLFVLLGYLILYGLDNLIPDHDSTKMTQKEMGDNLIHVGILSSVALVIHNIIEGMAIYSMVFVSLNTAITSMIGIGAHNIPLGMIIATTLYQSNRSKLKTLFIILLLALSTFIGGLIMFLLNTSVINDLTVGILLSLTIGMFIYILANELFLKVINKQNRKVKVIGLVIGIIMIICSTLI